MTRSTKAQHLSLSVLAGSRKANERRLPIHPAHFSRIDRRVRPRIFLERGYGSDFGAADDALAELVGGIKSRENSSSPTATFLLPKVQAEDLTELNVGQVVWGRTHPSIGPGAACSNSRCGAASVRWRWICCSTGSRPGSLPKRAGRQWSRRVDPRTISRPLMSPGGGGRCVVSN